MHAAVSARARSAERARPRRRGARRLAAPAGGFLLLAVAFTAYLRLSQTYPENSDEANILLMAGDLAHGNVLLSGWNVSDVPFISTELPEIALLVRLFGLHLSTAHIAAAFTYTVVLTMAGLLAGSGRRTVRARLVRIGIVAAIMLAPQPGVGVFVMLFSVGHIGTAAPVLLTWLVLERFRPRRPWLRPAAVAAGLGWALLADPLVLVIAVIPLVLVSVTRLLPDLKTAIRNGCGLRDIPPALSSPGGEASLALAAVAGYLLAWCGRTVLHALGGYSQPSVPFALAPASTWPGHARVMLHGLLELFGAYPVPGNSINDLGSGSYVAAAPPLSGLAEAVAVTRLACVALALWGVAVIARRFFRRDADLVSQLLLVGLVANLAAYLPSTLADHTALNVREFAPVLPFAAVLAARMTGPGILAACTRAGKPRGSRALAAVLAALFGWYCVGLAHQAAAPAAPDPFARLEAFLEARHLTRGIGGYWDASAITVDTGGAVTIRAVEPGCLQPYAWESKPAWYAPAHQAARFVLVSRAPGYFSQWRPSPAAQRQLDALFPAADRTTLDPGAGYSVQAYAGNLLARLPLLAPC